jgi:hypothetical protein
MIEINKQKKLKIMKNLLFTILFVFVSLVGFSQTLETNIIVIREDSIENQLDGTFQYTITQVEDTFKVVSKLDPHEYVHFKFDLVFFDGVDLGHEKLFVSEITNSFISDGNTDNYLKKIFEISKVKDTRIGLLVKPSKKKYRYKKEVVDGVEFTIVEHTSESVTEYIKFTVFNRKNEVAFKEY